MLRIGQVESSATADGKYTDGSVAGGIAATRLRAAAFNAIQEELANIVESAGMSLDPDDMTQVLAALKTMFAENNDILGALAELTGSANKLPYFIGEKEAALADLTAFARDILAQTDAAGVLSKLGLGAGGFPIGMPFFWPSATLPNLLLPEWSNMVFLKFNNSSFSATTYPKLAKIFPSLVLPDARGDFPRIWDDGRGVDPGRALLTEQGDAIRNISGYVDVLYGQVGGNRTGPFFNSNVPPQRYYTTLSGSGVDSYISMGFDASRIVPVAGENRPINIAFHLLVRAA